MRKIRTFLKGSDRSGRTAACNRTKQTPSDCLCVPAVKPDWDTFLALPPNPLMSGSVNPIDWQAVPVYFWIPELFFWKYMRHMPCVNCGHVFGIVHEIGWNEYGPRRVASLGHLYYVICLRYHCRGCDTSFAGFDHRAISKMPDFIQAQVPSRIYPKSAFIRIWHR